MSILNNHNRLNKQLISSGVKMTSKKGISSYIIGRKLFRKFKDNYQFIKKETSIELFGVKDYEDIAGEYHNKLEKLTKQTLLGLSQRYEENIFEGVAFVLNTSVGEINACFLR